MTDFEVPEASSCSPFEEPTYHWRLEEGAEPEQQRGRRPAHYFYRAPGVKVIDELLVVRALP